MTFAPARRLFVTKREVNDFRPHSTTLLSLPFHPRSFSPTRETAVTRAEPSLSTKAAIDRVLGVQLRLAIA